MLIDSRNEPNSAQGFIFAATIIGAIPSIPIIPFLYFIFMNWFIQEKLSNKYINVPKDKYLYWSKYIHFTSIAIVFFVLFGLLSYIAGGGILPHQTFYAIPFAFSDNFSERIGGISAFLYYGVGCVFLLIMIVWNIIIVFSWVFKKIGILLEKWKNARLLKKEQKMAKKIEKVESKKIK
ncbi:hypothetical protein [Spiroplasma litorale]|uniref:hypothetical protein n=1 Tax=Spiroplasma litorale TaxID=216942 RepID=UPI0011876B31|nr:hypothetical protein [Spiroplasma litorale]